MVHCLHRQRVECAGLASRCDEPGASLRPHPLKDARKQGLGPVTHRQAAVPQGLVQRCNFEEQAVDVVFLETLHRGCALP